MSDVASGQVPRRARRAPLVPAADGSVSARDAAPTTGPEVLDNPVWASLANHHAALAQRAGQAAVVLGLADVPEMLDLVERTRPGPFLARTVELGTYLGLRRDGALVAMAGERLHPTGWTEISAVCTDPAFRGQGLAFRGQGLATRLVRAVGGGLRSRGAGAVMAAAATNTNAIRLYESIGVTLRRRTPFTVVRTPAAGGHTTITEERA
jgi:ribosomal protein S18 acetylase RimI-like enzyme